MYIGLLLIIALGREICILFHNNQRHHRTLQVQNDVLPYAFCWCPLPCVSRSCEQFLDGFDLRLLP